MHVLITGGTGFVGRHLVDRLRQDGHQVRILARGCDQFPSRFEADDHVDRVHGSVTDRSVLESSADEIDAVAHLAGINFERGTQTFRAVHDRGTANVVAASQMHDVDRLVLTSYLRARPWDHAGYLASKWVAEEHVRHADVPWTILKPAGVFGPGDQLLTHLATWFRTVPVLPIPRDAPPLRPVAIEDLIDVLHAAITRERLSRKTVAVMGAESVSLSELAHRVRRHLGRNGWTIPIPLPVLVGGAIAQELTLEQPIVTRASLRMLAEGMMEPAPSGICDPLPRDLGPQRAPSPEYIREALAAPERLGLADIRTPIR